MSAAVFLQEEKVEWLLDHLRLRSAWDAFDNAVTGRVIGNAGVLLRVQMRLLVADAYVNQIL